MCLLANVAMAQTATSRIVSAANAFLSILDQKQRGSVLLAFDEKQRVRWSNFPTAVVRRAGLSIGELNPRQRSAARALVSSALSRKGFDKVQEIMVGDEVSRPAREQSALRQGSLLHLHSGNTLGKDGWMLQFGGHHLALNITITGEQGVLTPSLTGAQPAVYTANGKTVRPLGQENDKAFALLNALDESQRKQALLNYRVADLVLGPGQDGKTVQPEGLKASAMNGQQRAMLLDRNGRASFTKARPPPEWRRSKPTLPRPGVTGQYRNYEQSLYQLDYVQPDVRSGPLSSAW
jgi:hypothetical protein